MNYQAHIEQACASALTVMHKIISIGRRRLHIPMKVISMYHQALLVTIVGYGAHRPRNILPAKKLLSLQRNVLMRMTGAYRSVATDTLTTVLEIRPLDLQVRKKAACYWLKRVAFEMVEMLTKAGVRTLIGIDSAIGKEWQEIWRTIGIGRRTFSVLPSIAERVELKHLNPSQGLVHFLTGKGPYKAS
uniref:Uncharacterized protein n=1 Tax=Timema monikensis TaxID=170555 RepID=A0A7R9HL46_9NEOP|nr:unnamed protein product [Timema monikensis]